MLINGIEQGCLVLVPKVFMGSGKRNQNQNRGSSSKSIEKRRREGMTMIPLRVALAVPTLEVKRLALAEFIPGYRKGLVSKYNENLIYHTSM